MNERIPTSFTPLPRRRTYACSQLRETPILDYNFTKRSRKTDLRNYSALGKEPGGAQPRFIVRHPGNNTGDDEQSFQYSAGETGTSKGDGQTPILSWCRFFVFSERLV
jgi:hypothetical protein